MRYDGSWTLFLVCIMDECVHDGDIMDLLIEIFSDED